MQVFLSLPQWLTYLLLSSSIFCIIIIHVIVLYYVHLHSPRLCIVHLLYYYYGTLF